jgi:hypothetical protein
MQLYRKGVFQKKIYNITIYVSLNNNPDYIGDDNYGMEASSS